jgi:hypothetical protein
LFALATATPNQEALPMRAATTKSLNDFGSCFTRLQERDSRVWAFLPRPGGGIFTNAGARGVTAQYWLAFDEAKPLNQIRLLAGSASANLVEAVRACR